MYVQGPKEAQVTLRGELFSFGVLGSGWVIRVRRRNGFKLNFTPLIMTR